MQHGGSITSYLITSITPSFHSNPFKILNLLTQPSPLACSHSLPAAPPFNLMLTPLTSRLEIPSSLFWPLFSALLHQLSRSLNPLHSLIPPRPLHHLHLKFSCFIRAPLHQRLSFNKTSSLPPPRKIPFSPATLSASYHQLSC